MEELGGEKIDIIKWSEDMAKFVSAALAPADVVAAAMQPDGKSCRVVVPDDQLSLAIGKEGQNARLAAKLTGCKIDIAPSSQVPQPEESEAQQEAQPEQAPAVEMSLEEAMEQVEQVLTESVEALEPVSQSPEPIDEAVEQGTEDEA